LLLLILTVVVTAVLLLLIGLSTYLALASASPLQYTIPMTAAGLLLTGLRSRSRWRIFLSWILLLSGIGTMAWVYPYTSFESMLFTLLAVVTFCAFWLVSERYKRQEHVGVRAGQHFFLISLVCGIALLPLIPFSNLPLLDGQTLLMMIAFGLLISGLPYYVTYFHMSPQDLALSSAYSFTTIGVTLVGQILLMGTVRIGIAIPIAVVSAAALILLDDARMRKTLDE
jgi:drug/metabolite transporter (DMT)-like permease